MTTLEHDTGKYVPWPICWSLPWNWCKDDYGELKSEKCADDDLITPDGWFLI